jgi:hypothetical protein
MRTLLVTLAGMVFAMVIGCGEGGSSPLLFGTGGTVGVGGATGVGGAMGVGGAVGVGGAMGTGGAGDVCSVPGGSCVYSSECCGYEASGATEVCLSDDYVCHSTCTSGSQCESGCCIGTTVNGQASYGACVAASNCSCAQAGYACAKNSDCCGYATTGASEICLSVDDLCHATCTSGSQCASGCCVTTTINGQASYGACAAASYCN